MPGLGGAAETAMSDTEDGVRVHNGEVEVGESEVSGEKEEKPSEKHKKVGEWDG